MTRLAVSLALVLQVFAAAAQWHAAAGVGLWFAFIDRSSTVLPYTNNADKSRFYVQTGFHC